MSGYNLRLIEMGLDYYLAEQRRIRGTVVTRGFRRSTLAHCINRATGRRWATPDAVSAWLQEYRQAQGTTAMDWHLACRGYARAARWRIISGPGLARTPDGRDTGEALLLDQAAWVVADLAARATSDLVHELMPGTVTRHHPALNARLAATQVRIEHALADLVAEAEADTALWEALTSRAAIALTEPTADQLALEAEIARGP
jgi:hypothetical protein